MSRPWHSSTMASTVEAACRLVGGLFILFSFISPFWVVSKMLIASEVDRRGPSAIHLTMSEALVSENRIARVFWRSIFERVASISRRMSPRMVCWSFCSKKCFYSYMFLDFSAPWEEEDVPLEWSPEISVKKWKGWRKSAESPAALVLVLLRSVWGLQTSRPKSLRWTRTSSKPLTLL